MAVEYPQVGQGKPVMLLNKQFTLTIPPASSMGYRRVPAQLRAIRKLIMYPVWLNRPSLSRERCLSKPASTVSTFPDFLFCSLGYKRYPAKRKTKNNQEDKYYPAGFRHFLFNDGHTLMIAEWTFKSHSFSFYCFHVLKYISL